MAHLLEAVEKLVPVTGPIESVTGEEYIEQLHGHSKDPKQWKLFRHGDKNYAVYRADFIFPDRDDDTEVDSVVQATELYLTKARRIGEALLVPGMSVDYTGAEGASGYFGFKTWLITKTPDKPLEDVFWVPPIADITGNGVPVYDEHGERVTMPDLGTMCTRQMLAMGDRVNEVSAENQVGPDDLAIAQLSGQELSYR